MELGSWVKETKAERSLKGVKGLEFIFQSYSRIAQNNKHQTLNNLK